MRSENDTPVEQRFLMILGRLSGAMIQEMDDKLLPPGIERIRELGNMTDDLETAIGAYYSRDKSHDTAFLTSFAYADLPIGKHYDALWSRKAPHEPIEVRATIQHAIFDGTFPSTGLDHGHRHVVFLKLEGCIPDCIPTYGSFADITPYDWEFGLSSLETAVRQHNSEQGADPNRVAE